MPSGIHNGQRNHRTKHRSNNWASGPHRQVTFAPDPAATEFEMLVARLHVLPQYWSENPAIRLWVHQHKNYKYVPESLLDELGETVLWEEAI
jgi:hypothetical protein